MIEILKHLREFTLYILLVYLVIGAVIGFITVMLFTGLDEDKEVTRWGRFKLWCVITVLWAILLLSKPEE